MSKSVIHAVFNNNNDAGSALEAISHSGVSAKKIAVLGEDSDSFREATSSLQSGKICGIIIWMAVIGSAIGALAGFAGMPAVDPTSQLMASISGTLAGLVLGLFSGVWMAGIINIDNLTESEAEIREGTVTDGAMAVSIIADDEAQSERIRLMLCEHQAAQVYVEFKEPVIR